jgi:hypothetical protein
LIAHFELRADEGNRVAFKCHGSMTFYCHHNQPPIS